MNSSKRVTAWSLTVLFAVMMAGRATAGYMTVVLGDNPVAYYRLGEASGPAVNSGTGGSALNASYQTFAAGDLANPGPRPPAYLGFEAANQAPHFDGSSDVVQAADNAALDITGALTVEAWVKLDALSGFNQGIVAKYAGGSFGNQRAYNLCIDNQTSPGNLGQASFVVSADGTFANASSVRGTSNLNDGEWHHVVATYEPLTALRIYVDGTLENANTTNIIPQIANTTAPLWIGLQYETTAGYHLDGYIDEAAVYNYALDASRVLAHYEAAFAADPPPRIPEPAALALLGLGLAAFARRRRK